MMKNIWQCFLTFAFIIFGMLAVWDLAYVIFSSFDFVRNQLEPPAAPTWKTNAPATAGRHVSDIPLAPTNVKAGIMALGIDNSGDYAPLIMQSDGAVRSAGVTPDGKHWIAIRVDPQGRVICSPITNDRPKGLRVTP